MHGSFVVASNSGSASASTPKPVQIIKIVRPAAGQTENFHASFEGSVKIDFTAIANEQVTFFHDSKNQSLHVIFTDGSQVIIEPFFDSMGVMSNLVFEMSPGQALNSAEFASQFPITTDQSVLPTLAEGPTESGAEFNDPSVDSLPPNIKLALLPEEELPTWEIHETIPVLLPTVEEEAIIGNPTTTGFSIELDEDGGAPAQLPNSIAGGPGDSNAPVQLSGVAQISFGPGGVGSLTFDVTALNALGLKSGGDLVTFSWNAGTNTLTAVAGGETVLTLEFTDLATGSYELTLSRQLDHEAPAPGTSFENEIVLQLPFEITDGLGNTASGTVQLTIDDDTPTIDVTQSSESAVVLTTQDTETDGDPTDEDMAFGDFSDVFGLTSSMGADVLGTAPVLAYALNLVGAPGTDSGLDSNGVAINLYNVGGVIVGSTALVAPATATDPSVVFSIAVDSAGLVTLTQYAEIDHPIADDPTPTGTPFEDQLVVLGSGLVNLTASATITDGDGDSASDSETIDLGGKISFADDGPAVTANAINDSIVLTTQDAETDGDPTPEDTASASFAAAFLAAAVPVYGADGPGTTVISGYALNLVGAPGTDSGLDSNGVAINLYNVGGVIVGSTALVAPATATDPSVVFSIAVDSAGLVTLTQYAEIDHLPEDVDATNDNFNIGLATGLVTLTATATVTDGDNDTATTTVSADLGGNISFDDDVPSVTANAINDSIVLTTQDAETDGDPTPEDTASASFAAAFLAAAVPVYGADGPGTTVISGYALNLVGAPGTDSGLDSNGVAINLYNVGGVIVGSTALVAPATATDPSVVFSIAVDSAGLVTLTQYAEIDHLPEDVDATNDNFNIGLATGLVTLTATATVTDGDNDTATTTVSADLGGNISFDDDVPSVTANAINDSIVLTTQDAETDGDPTPEDTASASFAAAFLAAAVPVYGADGPGTTVISGYALNLVGAPGTDSGLDSNGVAINLYNVGGVIVGSTALVAPATATDPSVVFSIAVDSAGLVTLTQYAEIDHLPEDVDATNDNFNIGLATGLVTLTATATVTDGDNDTATTTVSADLGGNISFDDDVPSVTANAINDSIVLTTQDAETDGDPTPEDTASASFAAAFLAAAVPVYGADGPGTTVISGYALNLVGAPGTDSGLDSNGVAINLYNVGGVIVGSTALVAPATATDPSVVFSIAVDSAGLVTLTQYAEIDHLPEDVDATNDNFNIGLATGLVTLTATATVTDGDNDTATTTVSADLGGNISFDDDVPSVTANAINDSIVLTTQDAETDGDPTPEDTASASFAAAFLAAAVPVYGADGPGTTVISGYALNLVGAPGTDSGLDSNGVAINLYNVGGVIVGSTALVAPATATDPSVVFSIAVDSAGLVTLTQYAEIDHLPEDVDATNDNFNIGLATGLVTLTATATVTDGDNDTATTTVSADLGGNISFDDDVPSVTANATVLMDDEAATTTYASSNLGGTGDLDPNPANPTGTLTLSHSYGADGAGTTLLTGAGLSTAPGAEGSFFQTVSGGGLTLTISQVQNGISVVVLTVSLVDAASGNYSVQQNNPIFHPTSQLSEENVTFTVAYQVTDGDGDTASGSVVIDVDDDTPVITDIQDAVVANTTGSVVGTIDMSYGADGGNQNSPSLVTVTTDAGDRTTNSGLVITGWDDLPGIVETLSADGKTLTATGAAGVFYTLVLDDTTNTYTLTYTERPVVHIPVEFPPATGGPGVEILTATGGAYEIAFNGGIFNGISLVDLGLADDDDDVKSTGNGFGIGGSTGQTTFDNNEGFTATFSTGGNPVDVDSITFGLGRLGGNPGANVTVNWVAYDNGVAVVGGSGSQVLNLPVNNAIFLINVDPPGQFDKIEVWITNITGTNNVRLENFLFATSVIPEDQPLQFDIAAVDGDGDISATARFDVLLQGGAGPNYTVTGIPGESEVLAGGTGNDTIAGGDNNDTLIGRAGADALDGGTGIDTFVVNAVVGTSSDSSRVIVVGNDNDTGQDTISGFDFSNETLKIVATNVSSFVHGTDTAVGVPGGVNDGTQGSFLNSVGLIELNQTTNNNWSDPGDIAVTFASPVGTFDEANFEARLEYALTGTSGADTITTGALNDVLNGGDGIDTLTGGAGNDSLTGGTANDLFVLNGLSAVANGHDTILDFSSGNDDIFVDVASLGATIGTASNVAAADFHTGDETNAATWSGGNDANEFVWNATTQELWYSANGTGSDRIDLAHMSTGVPVAADIHTF